MESVIFQSPVLMCGYAVALALCIAGIVKKTGMLLTVVA